MNLKIYRNICIRKKQLKGINHPHRKKISETNRNSLMLASGDLFDCEKINDTLHSGRVAATEDKQFKRVSPVCGQFAALHIHCKNTIQKRPKNCVKTLFIRCVCVCFLLNMWCHYFRSLFFFSLLFHNP